MYSPGPKSPGAGAAPRPSFMLVRQSETFYTRTLELFLVSLSFYAHHKKPFIPRDYSLTFHLHQDLHSWYFCAKYWPHRVMIPLFFVYYILLPTLFFYDKRYKCIYLKMVVIHFLKNHSPFHIGYGAGEWR